MAKGTRVRDQPAAQKRATRKPARRPADRSPAEDDAQLLQAARQQARRAAEALRGQPLALDAEPAFTFRA